MFGGNLEERSSLQQLVPQNPVAFSLVVLGIIIFGISIGFVFLRIPNVKLPTAEELYTIENIKKHMPPNPQPGTTYSLRDSTNPFPPTYGTPSTDPFNKIDFINLYNNYIKPTLESNLLNNQTLIISKTDKIPDITISLCFAFLGLVLLFLGVTFYTRKIQSLMGDTSLKESM